MKCSRMTQLNTISIKMPLPKHSGTRKNMGSLAKLRKQKEERIPQWKGWNL